jgi:hypothetical protein
MKEKFAAICVLAVLAAVPGLVFWYQEVYRPSRYPERVIAITGVAGSGAWTLERVSGLNYWWKSFAPATIHLQLHEQVVFQFHSADVFHQFYVPGLDIGPVSVEPGHVREVRFRPRKAGVFQYYCTSMCGGCHFYMRGWIVVTPPGEKPATPPAVTCPLCLPEFETPPEGDPIALGEHLYRAMACITCHGIGGRGGVENFNYIADTVPAHHLTAKKLFMSDAEDAETFLELVQNGVDVIDPPDPPDIARYPLVRSRVQAAIALIKNGKNAARLDPSGPEPPLQMPAWQDKLDPSKIQALLGYFVSLYPWDEDEPEESEPGGSAPTVAKPQSPANPAADAG